MIPTSLRSRHESAAGILLVELVVAMSVLTLVVAAGIGGLLVANRYAAANRALTAARLVVERNIERALSVSYDLANVPPILAVTGAGGVVWDDDGGGDGMVSILTQNATGNTAHLKGTLRRSVSLEPTPNNAGVRRVTFRLDFTYLGRPLTAQMTTLRAVDDF
jgi:hypothetical protein